MHICFLDIDGTLVLTGGAGQTAFARTLAEDFGIETIDGSVPFAGRSDRAIAMDLFRRHGVPATEDNWQRFRAGYLDRLQDALVSHKGRVLPGVPELLNALASRGDVAVGLLTGNLREGARCKLSYYGLWEHFPFGGFGDEYLERCDIAAAALSAARSHLACLSNGSSNDDVCHGNGQVVVIGDTLHDISCGRSIGASCVAVPTGHTSAEVLGSGKPDALVATLEDVGPVLALFDRRGR
jgi:phosphoglycolate phosphatase-like HAD superfamily hydrolase